MYGQILHMFQGQSITQITSLTCTTSVSLKKNLVLIFLLMIWVRMKSFLARHSLICSKMNLTFSSRSIDPNVSTYIHTVGTTYSVYVTVLNRN